MQSMPAALGIPCSDTQHRMLLSLQAIAIFCQLAVNLTCHACEQLPQPLPASLATI